MFNKGQVSLSWRCHFSKSSQADSSKIQKKKKETRKKEEQIASSEYSLKSMMVSNTPTAETPHRSSYMVNDLSQISTSNQVTPQAYANNARCHLMVVVLICRRTVSVREWRRNHFVINS